MDDSWLPATLDDFTIAPNEIQLWRAPLDLIATPDLLALLNNEERARAECFRFDRDR